MNTLVHTSSRQADANLAIARVLAAGRVQAARKAEEARRAALRARNARLAAAYVSEAREAGAVRMGFKVCLVDAKYRMMLSLEDAEQSLTFLLGEDVECWGLNPAGEYVWSMM